MYSNPNPPRTRGQGIVGTDTGNPKGQIPGTSLPESRRKKMYVLAQAASGERADWPFLCLCSALRDRVVPICPGEGPIPSQSTDSNANLFHRHLHRHSQQPCLTSFETALSPVRLTQKTDPHKAIASSLVSLLPTQPIQSVLNTQPEESFLNKNQIMPLLCPKFSSGFPKPSEYNLKF